MPRIRVSTGDIEADTPPELDEGGVGVEDIHVTQERDLVTAAKEAKFMEEKVVINIEMDEEDENAPLFVFLGHGGVSQWVQRGTNQSIKRKFLYSALAARRMKIASAYGKSGDTEYNRASRSPTTTYRVQLVSDDNPQGGMKWVSAVMRKFAEDERRSNQRT